MTIVEFFDDEVMDNAVGTLLLQPERAVILYSGEKDTAFLSAMEKILTSRNVKTKIIMEKIDVSTVDSAVKKIEEVIKVYPDCDFDIAGGNDIVLVAIGECARKYNLPLHSVDVVNRKVTSINGNKEYTLYDAFLSVEELVAIHGGKTNSESRVKATYLWKRDKAVEEDIEKIWNICKSDPSAWNAAWGKMKSERAEIWAKLKRERLVRQESGGVKFKNEVVRYLLSRQGTALEMYTYICAKQAEFFDDGQSGALLDWKGRREVENEIDVFLVKGAVGYFISCKNGMVDSNELYKLSAVADRFGGRYAKKILVISQFEPDSGFMNRAKEMGVKVIKNVKHLKKSDFIKKLIS